jgi:hypothetical protein
MNSEGPLKRNKKNNWKAKAFQCVLVAADRFLKNCG